MPTTPNNSEPFRHGLLRYFSAQELAHIEKTRIGIGGAGGLGSNVAMLLARCGFQTFVIIDKDSVEGSNLNRQYYFSDDIGTPKVAALWNYLKRLNPQVTVSSFQQTWDPATAPTELASCDIVLEAFDEPAEKACFVEFYQDKVRAVVTGNGMAGCAPQRPLRVQTLNNIYVVGDQTTDIADGFVPLAPRVMMCAAMMADVTLAITLGQARR